MALLLQGNFIDFVVYLYQAISNLIIHLVILTIMDLQRHYHDKQHTDEPYLFKVKKIKFLNG